MTTVEEFEFEVEISSLLELSACTMSFSLQSSLRHVTQTFVRSFQNKAVLKPVPPPQGIVYASRVNLGADESDVLGDITTPQAFLSAIGRSAETKVSIDSWDAFWRTSGYDLKKAGVAVKDRRQVQGCGLAYGHSCSTDTFYGAWRNTGKGYR